MKPPSTLHADVFLELATKPRFSSYIVKITQTHTDAIQDLLQRHYEDRSCCLRLKQQVWTTHNWKMGICGFADDEICYPHTGFNRNALDSHLRVLLYKASGVVFFWGDFWYTADLSL